MLLARRPPAFIEEPRGIHGGEDAEGEEEQPKLRDGGEGAEREDTKWAEGR